MFPYHYWLQGMLQDEYIKRSSELSEQADLLEAKGRLSEARHVQLEIQRLDLNEHPEIWSEHYFTSEFE